MNYLNIRYLHLIENYTVIYVRHTKSVMELILQKIIQLKGYLK